MVEKPTRNVAVKQLSSLGRTAEPIKLGPDEEASGWSQYDKYRCDPHNWNWPEKLGFAEEPIKTTLQIGKN